MITHEVREEQKCFLKNNRDPRPIKFFMKFMKFNYRSKSTGIRDYELRLNDVLQEDPYSESLSEPKKKWEAGEYKDDWANYEDEKNNRKTDVC
ncbi:unnamed protein product [Rhizophagus irregularis]|nr:unnamed protein product [Rhizophagus irregularis]